MLHAFVLVTVLVMVLLGALAVALAGMLRRVAKPRREEISKVSRQHFELFQGEPMNEAALEMAKTRYRKWLEQGNTRAIETSLRPGTHFVVQVRALAEIGTKEAGNILERQFTRKLSDDTLEQLWYWMDLACGLRALNHGSALPTPLRCADNSAPDLPLSHYLAVETASFAGFAGYLRQPDSTMGRSAVRVLRRALEGLRRGVEPSRLAEARVGDLVEALWDVRPTQADPRFASLLVEVVRVVRRLPAYENEPDHDDDSGGYDDGYSHGRGELADQEGWAWQASRLVALESAIRAHLRRLTQPLIRSLGYGSPADEAEVLQALIDLKANASNHLIPLLEDKRIHHPALAMRVLGHSTRPEVATWLAAWISGGVDRNRRSGWRTWARQPARPSIPPETPYAAALDALGRLGGAKAEVVLLEALHDFDPTYRRAAAAAFGWREPVDRARVRAALHIARTDSTSEVKYAARAALARLGEVQSLQMFRRGLESEDLNQRLVSIHAIASENIGLLWPDLDALADADDPVVSHHAREAVAQLAEADEPGLG